MKRIVNGFSAAFSMYSKIPMPHTEWDKETMKYFLCYFPLIGVVIGALMLGWDYLHGLAFDSDILRASILVLIPVAVTGGIHVDGYLDTSDALSSYKSMEEKLEILKDSHTGAFAIISGILYFLVLFGLYAETGTEELRVLAIGFVLSRAMSGLAVVTFRMAKNTGLAASFSEMAVKKRVAVEMVLYIAVCCIAMAVIDPLTGCMRILGAFVAFFWYHSMAYRKFGGITGDLAGFFVQVCELLMALAAVIAGAIG